MLKRFRIPAFARFHNADPASIPGATVTDAGDGGEKGGAALTPSTEGGAKPETVSRAEFERMQSDMHKYKKQAQAAKEQQENEKLARMKEQNQWKEIAEAKEREALEAKQNAERVQNSFLGEKKYGAVRSAAEKLGLRAEAMSDLEMLDLEAITIETTSTGKINVLGADKFAERLKTLKPHWFADAKQPGVNTTGNRVLDSSTTVTPKDLLAAEVEASKSGDMTKYRELHKRYQQQRLTARRG